MITQMEASNTQPDIPELPLGGFVPGSSDVIQVRNIDGLGPVKSTISSTPFATGRGNLFQGASIEARNIVLTLGLNPDWAVQTVTELRRLLYRYFMTGLWVRLRFLSDDMPEVYINGIVETCEPNIFSQDPEMQVSIICPKPDFIDEDTILITADSAEFPVGGYFGMPYEDMTGPEVTEIDYPGTAPSGFELRIEDDYTGDIAFLNATPDGVQYMLIWGVEINSTQRLDLNTVRSTRYIRNVNPTTGDAVNILAKMLTTSEWPEFAQGANRFAVYSSSPVEWTLGYLARYGGL